MAAVLTAAAIVQCSHQGLLTITPSRNLLVVDDAAVLIGDDVLAAVIACPNTPKPCTKVNSIDQGRAVTLFLGDDQALLATARGTTDVATWHVISAGQTKLEAT